MSKKAKIRIIGIISLILINLGFTLTYINPQNPYSSIIIILGLIGVLAFLLSSRMALTHFFQRIIQIKYFLNVVALIILGIGIPVFIELISARVNYRYDLTENKRFTLSEKTKNVLKTLKEPIDFYVFSFEGDQQFEKIKNLMDMYKVESKKINIIWVNQWSDPQLAKKFDVKTYGTIVVKKGDNYKKVTDVNEENITNAILEINSPKKTIYVLTGHGERNIDSSESNGLSEWLTSVKKDNYEVKKLILLEKGKVPEDCAVLVIPGPTAKFLNQEEKILIDYINNGGKVLALIDTDTPEEVVKFFENFGVKIGRDLVIDIGPIATLMGTNGVMPIITSFGNHKIVRNFPYNPILVVARSVEPDTSNARFQSTGLIYSSKSSWAEVDLEHLDNVKYDEGIDKAGPICLGVATEIELKSSSSEDENKENNKSEENEDEENKNKQNKARLVVFGDVDFITNSYIDNPGNSQLVLNSINWLAESENLIAIRPKEKKFVPIFLSQMQQNLILFLPIVLLPFNIFLIGMLIILPRRIAQ